MDFPGSDHPQVRAFIDDLSKDPSLPSVPAHFPHFDTLVILGIGGPALCGRLLLSASQPKQEVFFQNNLTSFHREWLSKQGNLSTVGILALSKSGETLETLLEVQRFLDAFKQQHLSTSDHFLIATEPQSNTLRTLAQSHALPILDLSAHIDGRFSLFSQTGQIIASLLEFDINTFRQGAQEALTHFSKQSIQDLHRLFDSQNALQEHVLWTYDPHLLPLVEWWAQLIGESLGKQGKGFTPIVAIGPRDQHSQLQLYLGGPHNKFFTFLCTSTHYKKIIKKAGKGKHSLDLKALKKLDLGDIVGLQMYAVMETLKEEHIPARLLYVNHKDVFQLGRVCMDLILEVWVLGFLQGINPFGQPDVEKVKQRVWDLLRRVSHT